MEDLKKRKLDETAGNGGSSDSEENLRSLLEPLAKPHLVELLAKLGSQYPSIAEEIKSIASADPVHRKLFVRGLAWNTTSETLCAAFQGHGEIEEGAVIYDKNTGKSRGYGFITYKNIESTQIALRAPSKMIDGRSITVKYAESHGRRMAQPQQPTTMVPMAPMAPGYPQSGYPQTGKAYPSMDPGGYPYPQAAPAYPGAAYPSPPAAPMPYAAQPQMTYPQLAVKKDQLGVAPTPPMGMGGYPYYGNN
ncbi:hypothetical protein ACJRO7_029034 [Eucalyptus globulus]|uniref:RRM domain-containing protein n=1 Tax=Eucalyptus globulus TaxID=34317 RepID=A0ABD3K6H0_EUCGL